MTLPVLRRHRSPDKHANEDASGRRPNRALAEIAEDSPWAEFARLHERMGQLLSATSHARALKDTFDEVLEPAGRWLPWNPAADVEETADAYLVEIELPGVKREDVSVEFGGGELAVTGEYTRRERLGWFRKHTRPIGRFAYRVSLSPDVLEEQIHATLTDGVLTVRIPKAEHARRRSIPIKASS